MLQVSSINESLLSMQPFPVYKFSDYILTDFL